MALTLALGFLLLLVVVVVAATLQDTPPALDAELAPERPAVLPMTFKPSSPASPASPPPETRVTITDPSGNGRTFRVTNPAQVAAVVARERTAAVGAKAVGTSIAVYVITYSAEGTEGAPTLAEKMTLVKHRETPTGPLVFRWRVDKAREVGPS